MDVLGGVGVCRSSLMCRVGLRGLRNINTEFRKSIMELLSERVGYNREHGSNLGRSVECRVLIYQAG